jgi:hypothetical protein
MATIASQRERAYPQSNENKGIVVNRLLDRTLQALLPKL